jgi:rubrerythrin
VHAFRTLARELAAEGAPASLVEAARSAARDEIRHARLTRRMALQHGSRPAPVRVAKNERRSLEAIATENAVEGCVRETFGALLATWQARAAGDESVRALMSGIAVDETRHAELAWAVDAWTARKLDREARRRVRAARAAVIEEVAAELREPPAPELVARVGMPDVDRAAELFAAVRTSLWS